MADDKKTILHYFLMVLGALIMMASGLCTGTFLVGSMRGGGESGIAVLSLVIGTPFFLLGLVLFYLGGGFGKKRKT